MIGHLPCFTPLYSLLLLYPSSFRKCKMNAQVEYIALERVRQRSEIIKSLLPHIRWKRTERRTTKTGANDALTVIQLIYTYAKISTTEKGLNHKPNSHLEFLEVILQTLSKLHPLIWETTIATKPIEIGSFLPFTNFPWAHFSFLTWGRAYLEYISGLAFSNSLRWKCEAWVDLISHHGESVSNSILLRGMALTTLRFSSVFREQPLIPMKRPIFNNSNTSSRVPVNEWTTPTLLIGSPSLMTSSASLSERLESSGSSSIGGIGTWFCNAVRSSGRRGKRIEAKSELQFLEWRNSGSLYLIERSSWSAKCRLWTSAGAKWSRS